MNNYREFITEGERIKKDIKSLKDVIEFRIIIDRPYLASDTASNTVQQAATKYMTSIVSDAIKLLEERYNDLLLASEEEIDDIKSKIVVVKSKRQK